MSEENVEIVRRGYDAMRRRDLHALLSVIHPEFEGEFRIMEVEGTVLRGHEGMRRFAEEIWSVFPDWQPEVDETRSVDKQIVVAKVLAAGRGVGSGVELAMTVWQVIKVRDEKIITMRSYPTETDALEAVGLSE